MITVLDWKIGKLSVKKGLKKFDFWYCCKEWRDWNKKKSWKRHGQQRVECTFQNALLSWHVSRSKIQFRVQYEFLFWEPLTSFGDNFEAEMACLWPYLFRHSCHSSSPKASLRTLLERQGYIRKTGVPPEFLPCQRWIFKLAIRLLDKWSF